MKLNKTFIIVMLTLVAGMTFTARAQYRFEVREIDFDKIQRETLDPESRYYYPKLVRSFNSNDTIMNFEAYRDLYYGFLFQEDYNPFRNTEFEGKEEVEQLYYNKGQDLTRDECDQIEKYAVRALDDNMFDIDQICSKRKSMPAQLCASSVLTSSLLQSCRVVAAPRRNHGW